ncbi:LysE family translocator [Vibrio sp. Of7-15]|uniref:LysE family translocator n=1 Tax=Vibrio sp. Of7-15 TaxID=2724879 RepID=UPI001EF2B95D|nr:LysE family translocator [Vibrio sp. Of7-15]MCG7499775.1 LysE family translocator [Vibrio sp. Of7-15]
MNEVTTLLTLITVHVIALMSPGPDFALVVQNAGRYGRQTGILIALGLSLGILLHSILSLTGASLIIQQQPTLFAIFQGAGGGYLLWLGINAVKSVFQTALSSTAESTQKTSQRVIANRKQALAKGFTTSILNPKALVFFLSLLSTLVPVDMSITGKVTAIVMLWISSFLWFAILAWLLTGKKLQAKLLQWTPFIDGICGVLFATIGSMILLNLII